ncbi:MAG: signal peptidase [Actinomycetota bacterium]|jgi:signal peptidase|nr:signal peptidase [Actinomycetota bacterium]
MTITLIRKAPRLEVDTWSPSVLLRRRGRRAVSILLWLAVLAVVVVAWPARFGGHLGLTQVAGHSMDGTFRTGDLVVTWRHPSYRPGEVVVYRIPDADLHRFRVVHRIRAVGADGRFVTQGDNNANADPWRPDTHDVEGSVLFRVPGAGHLLSAVFSPLALLLLCAALAGYCVFHLVAGTGRGDEESEVSAGETSATV